MSRQGHDADGTRTTPIQSSADRVTGGRSQRSAIAAAAALALRALAGVLAGEAPIPLSRNLRGPGGVEREIVHSQFAVDGDETPASSASSPRSVAEAIERHHRRHRDRHHNHHRHDRENA